VTVLSGVERIVPRFIPGSRASSQTWSGGFTMSGGLVNRGSDAYRPGRRILVVNPPPLARLRATCATSIAAGRLIAAGFLAL